MAPKTDIPLVLTVIIMHHFQVILAAYKGLYLPAGFSGWRCWSACSGTLPAGPVHPTFVSALTSAHQRPCSPVRK